MDKNTKHKFGKDYYLIGKGKDGELYWLEEGSWDCGWYWGIGYVETFERFDRDISSHQHWDNLFPTKDKFDDFFEETVISEKETWIILELMKSIYTARNYSDMIHIGGSHYTSNPNKEDIKNDTEYKRINEVVIPKLLESVYAILS